MAGTTTTSRRPRALRTGIVAVFSLLTFALAACTPPVAPSQPPNAPSNPPMSGKVVDLGRDITKYVRLPGNQVVVVPNGTYSAGSVEAPHPAAAGALGGWLVLKAQSKHGVVVDLSRGPLTLGSSTSRVLFVGFKFVNGSLEVAGSDIAFWYTDHTFPANEWVRQAPNPRYPEQGRYRAPRTVYANEHSTRRVRFLGSDLHRTGTAILVSKSEDLVLDGTHIYDLSDMGLDPQDVVHPDAIGGVGGETDRFTVRNSWIQGRVMLIDSNGSKSWGGPHRDFLFSNVWVSDSPSSGFTFTNRKPSTPWGIFGRRVNVRSWGHNNGKDRISIINGQHIYSGNPFPTRVNVIDHGVVTSPPAANTPSPAHGWRAVNGYDDWMNAL
jgi:hypothetical protein